MIKHELQAYDGNRERRNQTFERKHRLDGDPASAAKDFIEIANFDDVPIKLFISKCARLYVESNIFQSSFENYYKNPDIYSYE